MDHAWIWNAWQTAFQRHVKFRAFSLTNLPYEGILLKCMLGKIKQCHNIQLKLGGGECNRDPLVIFRSSIYRRMKLTLKCIVPVTINAWSCNSFSVAKCLLAFLLVFPTAVLCKKSFTAAVFEHRPRSGNEKGIQQVANNLKYYEKAATVAADKVS